MHYVVVGLGKTGVAAATYLLARGEHVALADNHPNPPAKALLEKRFGPLPGCYGEMSPDLFSSADVIVLSPGVPESKLPPLKGEAEVVSDVELFVREVKAPVIAITGSNAKSTVTTMVGEVAKAAGVRAGVGGNLGEPVLSLLADENEVYILELSSFQLETTYSLKPRIATILNISPDHLDRHKTFSAYVAAKHRIYHDCTLALFNAEDERTVPANKGLRAVSFGVGADYHCDETTGELKYQQQALLPMSAIQLPGRHNRENALAVMAIAHQMGWPMDAVEQVLKTFPGLPHRCERVAEYAGITWYNDSKGTNVGATQAAVKGLGKAHNKLVLLLGGVGKGADFTPLRDEVAQYCRSLIIYGEAKDTLKSVLAGTVPLIEADDLQDIIAKAAEVAEAGDAVVLSPACASFDMFENFEDRGAQFKQAVQAQFEG